MHVEHRNLAGRAARPRRLVRAWINIDNFRSREWAPTINAAGVEHRRISGMQHTFATWSLAAGMSIFPLARRMLVSHGEPVHSRANYEAALHREPWGAIERGDD